MKIPERQPEETPKIAMVDKGPAQTGFEFDKVIVCAPPIPVESSSVLGYLGHWDTKQLMHFEIFCDGSNDADLITKGRAAASKDKQKTKTFLKKGTALYQYNPAPNKDITLSKGNETKTGGVYYNGANAIKLLKTEGAYEKWQNIGEYRAKKVTVAKKEVKQYEIIAGTMQTFWMIKGIPTNKDYGISKHADAHFFTKQDIKGWSDKPLDEITPDVIIKTLPYDLYSKKAGKKVSFQKNDYSQYTIRQENCKANEPYDVYIKDTDAVKHSKHEWKDFTSIKESNPTSIGTVAKEALVQSKAEEIKTVPALGHLANKDDDLSPFAKQILERIELHKTIENKEIKDDVCLLTGYKKLPYIYECEQERSKLMRLVCKHPTEWRYAPKKADVLKLSEAQNKQVKALSWWDQASAIKELPQPQNVWHFHPVGFVGNLEGGTLCERGFTTDEFIEMIYFLRDKEKIITEKEKFFDKKRTNGVIKEISITDGTPLTDNKSKISLFVTEMNNMFSKYEINNCGRKIHFISQMYLETMRFRATTEANSHYCLNYKGNCKFRGRGAKQLTHDYNHLAYYDYLNNTKHYETYIKFRSGYDSVTETVLKKKHSDINKELLTKITIFADTIGSNLYYALDSAGWFSTIQSPEALDAMDEGLSDGDVRKVTKIINGGANNLKERQNYTRWLIEFMKDKGCEL